MSENIENFLFHPRPLTLCSGLYGREFSVVFYAF